MREAGERAKYRRANLNRCRPGADQEVDEVYLERWAAMFNLLRSIPDDDRFDMNNWGVRAETQCNTAACAAGHGMLCKWFNDRGLKLEYWTTDSRVQMDFNQEPWFGCAGGYDMPFDPLYCSVVLHMSSSERLTTKMVSEVVMAWMLNYWEKELVTAAIAQTVAAQYDMAYVHEHVPWNKFFKTAEQEVKNA